MFVVETEEFSPEEGIKIKIRKPSYPLKMKAMAAMGNIPVEGPAQIDFGGMLAHNEILFMGCVLSVEGIQYDGKELKSAKELWDNGNVEIVNRILGRIGAISEVSESVRKK